MRMRHLAISAALAGMLLALNSGSGVPVGAAIDVAFDEWTVPTAKSRPHDPAISPDGTAWWTGQLANVIGRLDPKTGALKEFPLPTEKSGPHGLVPDKDGNIWYTGQSGRLIGKLDPKTGKVTEYKMPNERADPHTPIFDQNGTLWFTVQSGNFIGKVDPATGMVTLKEAPTPNSRPYGIVVNSKGVPFFDLSGTNKIGSIDPQTLAITEYTVIEGARPRRIAVTKDDIVWYTDPARGYLGRLNPATRDVKEFPSPSGPKSQPYGMTTTADGAVWYSESGVQPNTLVRFDPATSTFQKWDIPNGGGVVRHMVTGADGSLWLAYSGIDKIGRVRIKTTS